MNPTDTDPGDRCGPEPQAPWIRRAEDAAIPWLTRLVAVLLAVSLLWPLGMMAASCVLMGFGLWCVISGRWRWTSEERPGALINASFALYAFGSMSLVAFNGDAISGMEQFLPFLGAGLLLIGLRTSGLRPTLVGSALAAATVLAAVASGVSVLTADGMHRAEFLMVGTAFGAMGSLYAILCACLLGWEGRAAPTSLKRWLAAGMAGGDVVALLSGSKGAWLPLLTVGPFALWFGARSLGPRVRSALVAGLLAGVAAAIWMPNSPVVARTQEALRDGDPIRRAYWSAAAETFRAHPLTGSGRAEVERLLDRAFLSVRPYAPHERPPREAHNEYLDTLAVRGAAGFAFLLPVFIVPAAVFLKLRCAGTGSREAATTALLFIAAFALCGLTDALLLQNVKRMTYLFVVLFCVAWATPLRSTDTAKE